MNRLKDEKGIALVTALMLTLITLGIIMALMYYVTQALQVSAAHKTYRTALDASHGGTEFFTKELITDILSNKKTMTELEAAFSDVQLAFPDEACFREKLTKSTANWNPAVCGPAATTLDPKASPDSTFILKGVEAAKPGFKVYTKIVDTTEGNSDSTSIDYLDGGNPVAGNNPGVSPKHIPSVFRIEVQGERETNPEEKANLSVFYAF